MEEQAKPIATLLQITICKDKIETNGHARIFLDE
jgi:hypothetical protein